MKPALKSLHDTLTYHLQGLYYGEKKIREEFTVCKQQITSKDVRAALTGYTDLVDSKLLKLERIFNYLMENQLSRKNEVVDHMLKETHFLVDHAGSTVLKDILMLSCAQAINAYKTAAYKSAYLFALELDLETPSELLYQIISWELQAADQLSTLEIEEFNKANKISKTHES